MEGWWSALGTPEQVFFGIAFVSTAVLLLQVALMLFGMGDFDMDLDVDGADGLDGLDGHDSGFGLISVRSVLAFFTGFGWTGALAMDSGLGLGISMVLAMVVGGLAMVAIAGLMRLLYGLGEEGTLDYANAVGEVGSVYLPIPAAMAGPGQVEVRVQSRLRTVRAFTRCAEALENRRPVKVVGVIDQQTLLVEPLDMTGPEGLTSVESKEG